MKVKQMASSKIVAKSVFAVEAGTFVSKDSAKLTEKKVTDYDVA